ncbi:ATP synthase subunit I [Ruminococcus champanellensis]|uniref:ATP synthase subunit I n=1 Tax=Ruminococcus champanellensis TaxID=1161942 RepID=UPI002E7833C3|nr:ATP synthase subunit I [Ruminococcus champanellensis]MED9891152.1 ATP synthase subunit I [Ruminococcus champanellensis]
MQKDALLHELRVIGIRTVFLNIAVYLISGLVQGFTLSFAVGLLLGTALLFVYLLLLSRSVARSVEQPGGRPQVQMVSGYLLRLVLIGAVFLLAMQVSWINAFAAMIPLVYPRLIYVGHACLHKNGEQL